MSASSSTAMLVTELIKMDYISEQVYSHKDIKDEAESVEKLKAYAEEFKKKMYDQVVKATVVMEATYKALQKADAVQELTKIIESLE